MASVNVEATGLHALAGHCQVLAADVGGASASPALSTPTGQATAAAVQAIHAEVAAAGAAMVARLESTSAKLTAAAVSFTEQETASAAEVTAVVPASTV